MKLVLSSGTLEEPPYEVSEVNSLVVKDNNENPIYVAIHQNENSIWVLTPDDPRFADIVKNLGITQRLSVEFGS